jgi:ferredoxin
MIKEDAGEDSSGDDDMIRVRFKNAPNSQGKDVVVLTKPGNNILRLGDMNNITIPRACRTGLCGTCTADLVDPNWPEAVDDNGHVSPAGVQTIRCCSTGAMVPEGMNEMVIDLHRNAESSGEPKSNPMARFSDGWETDYVADYMKDDRVAANGDPNGQFGGGKKEPRKPPPVRDNNLNNQAPWDRVW